MMRFDGAHGGPRVTSESRVRGHTVSYQRIARMMRRSGIIGPHPREKVRTTLRKTKSASWPVRGMPWADWIRRA